MYIILLVIGIISSCVSGIAGMGGGVLLLTGLLFLFPLNIIIPIHGLAQLVSHFSRSFILRHSIEKNIFKAFILGSPIGGCLAYVFLNQIKINEAPLILIAFLLLYITFKPKKFPELRLSSKGFFLLGATASFLACFMGATGPLLAPFFLRSDLKKESIVATKAASQICVHLIKIPVFLSLDFDYYMYWQEILILISSVILGTKIGTVILRKIKREKFVLFIRALMFFIALRLIYKVSLNYL